MEAPRNTIHRAKTLRRRMTLPEMLLWQVIRRDKLGVRFRRQHPIGSYILDFYCDQVSLAVEIDGQAHDHPARIAHDRRRTDWLATQGVTVLRIPAREVLGNLEGVVEGLAARVRIERQVGACG